jgi:hypothetical protein
MLKLGYYSILYSTTLRGLLELILKFNSRTVGNRSMVITLQVVI